MALPYTLTIDKFEIQLQTNFVSPLVLTTKLLPILQKLLINPQITNTKNHLFKFIWSSVCITIFQFK